jgi:cytochrome c oxidase subunit 1
VLSRTRKVLVALLTGGSEVWNSKRLVLAHFWVAFIGFGGALLLGEWQMFIRSPLAAWIGDPELYYRSVTAHGTTMAYVFPTLVAMGFGYFVTEQSLKRPMVGLHWACADGSSPSSGR